MHGWETRMLLKHYLDQGVGKAGLSRRLGIGRRTIHYWIATGQHFRVAYQFDICTSRTVREHRLGGIRIGKYLFVYKTIPELPLQKTGGGGVCMKILRLEIRWAQPLLAVQRPGLNREPPRIGESLNKSIEQH